MHYFLNHTTGTVHLTMDNGHFTATTRGNGVLDKQKIIDILFSDLKNFCLVPVIGVQQLQNSKSAGDHSYDSEFIFSYREGQKTAIKRIFVDSNDDTFKRLLNELKKQCPKADLLHLPPAMALKQIGVAAPSNTIRILLALIIGIPVLVVLIFIVSKIVHG
ncbi:hypothetical protein [Niabella hirudinis]|uniref:hypothetical protein n=1 Tax=Niabella hirudinis TaxID=1285929 RepID=UPI003EBF2F34